MRDRLLRSLRSSSLACAVTLSAYTRAVASMLCDVRRVRALRRLQVTFSALTSAGKALFKQFNERAE